MSQTIPPMDVLKYDEMRLILRHLSVSELYDCLDVTTKWHQTIADILSSQKSLSIGFNDINHYTSEELSERCDNERHLAVNSSVGRLMNNKQTFLSLFETLSFKVIQKDLFRFLADYCPNVQSLDASQYSLNASDVDQLIANCPRLQCLYVTSDEISWTKFLNPKIAGLKHFSLALTTRTPIYGVHESPFETDLSETVPQIEDLIIKRALINTVNLDILCHYLLLFGSKLKKFHFKPQNRLTNEKCLELIRALTPEEPNKTIIKNLNINVFVFKELFKEINTKLSNIDTLYLHFNNESEQKGLLQNVKNLKEINLNFNSSVSEIVMEGIQCDSDIHFITLLPKLPQTITKLTLLDANFSLSVFLAAIDYLPVLREMQLISVFIESDSQNNFWQVICNYKNLVSLTLNMTNISDIGLEHLIGSDSLNTLELVKYNGPDANQTLIDTYRVIEVFGQLASLRPKLWFHLRLDIDVCEVNDQIKAQVPRNVKLVNIDYEKRELNRKWGTSFQLTVKVVDQKVSAKHIENCQTFGFNTSILIETQTLKDNVDYLSVQFRIKEVVFGSRVGRKSKKKFLKFRVGLIDKSRQIVNEKCWPEVDTETKQLFGWKKFMEKSRAFDSQTGLLDKDFLKFWIQIEANDERQSKGLDIQSVVENSYRNGFKSLLSDKCFTDFTVVVDDQEFAVHKAVLAARSPVFRAMIANDMKEKKESKVILYDTDKEVFEQLLHFIYTGSAPKIEEMAHKLSILADFYDIEDLRYVCAQTLFSQLSKDNVMEALRFGQTAMIANDMKEKKESKVILYDTDKEVFEQLLHFIYTGSAPKIEEMAHKLSIVADFYDIEDLRYVCAQTLFSQLSKDNVMEALRFGQTFAINELVLNSIDFIANNSEELKADIIHTID
ncbi:unnamed protein product [Medioppia subpectinata]|uniref:BTB domain-containing protein n=1 Tax=Medioppia subpectinata TaxID=1979941 RepID=A0A7R9Q4U6_9ACAR|nr:unnamed protein product [Medioppia subpectinata]CAG2112694.1 unnamed protein product [Medioppia subpectinata]